MMPDATPMRAPKGDLTDRGRHPTDLLVVAARRSPHAMAVACEPSPGHTAVIASPPKATTSPPDVWTRSIAGAKKPLRSRTSSSVPAEPRLASRSLSVVNPVTSRKSAAPRNRPTSPVEDVRHVELVEHPHRNERDGRITLPITPEARPSVRPLATTGHGMRIDCRPRGFRRPPGR